MMATRDDLDKAVSVVQRLTDELMTFSVDAAGARTLHREVERGIFDRVLLLGKIAMDVYLSALGNGDLGTTVRDHDGRTLQRSPHPVAMPVTTIFGDHQVVSFTYSSGAHEKIALRPVHAWMGFPEGKFSHLFEEFTQYFCVEQSFGAAATRFEMVFNRKVSVETLERLNVRMGAQAAAYLDDLPRPPLDQEAALLVASADGKGVPLVKADAAKVPSFAKLERPGNRRMATVGCVYSVDAYMRTPEQIVAALFRKEPETPWPQRPAPKFKQLLARFGRREADGDRFVDISSGIETWTWLRQQIEQRHRPGQPLVCIMDGQPSLWEAAATCLDELAVEPVNILDIVHAASYVWRAAKNFETTTERREAFVQTRLLRILNGDVDGVIAGMRQMATKRELTGAARAEIDTVCDYFHKQRDRMRYDEYLRAGYPIASGVIEGACRHLVKDRMERSGMRWTLDGAQAMLHVRAVDASGYWEEFHHQRIAKEHARIHPNDHLVKNYQPCPIAL